MHSVQHLSILCDLILSGMHHPYSSKFYQIILNGYELPRALARGFINSPYNRTFKPESLFASGLKPTIKIWGQFVPRAKARCYPYVF